MQIYACVASSGLFVRESLKERKTFTYTNNDNDNGSYRTYRMFTLATYACPVRVTSETFSSAIFIDREEIWNIRHSDWLNYCSYACAYFKPLPKENEPNIKGKCFLFLCFSLRVRKCEAGLTVRLSAYAIFLTLHDNNVLFTKPMKYQVNSLQYFLVALIVSSPNMTNVSN